MGTSTGSNTVPDDSPVRAAHAPPSPIPPDYRATYARVGSRRLAAQGHAGGRFDAEVFVTPSARDAAFGLLGKIEPGTILLMDQSPRGREIGSGTGGPTLMMEKRAPGFDPAHGDWRYVVVDGARIEDGALPLCARCHDEAPHDHVFGIED